MAQPPKKNDVVIKDEEQGIKDLLKDAGLLQFDQSDAHSMNGFKFSSRSSFKSYSEKNDSDQQFCTSCLIQSKTANSKRDSTQKREREAASATSITPPNDPRAKGWENHFLIVDLHSFFIFDKAK